MQMILKTPKVTMMKNLLNLKKKMTKVLPKKRERLKNLKVMKITQEERKKLI
jgi:hypothetical protein